MAKAKPTKKMTVEQSESLALQAERRKARQEAIYEVVKEACNRGGGMSWIDAAQKYAVVDLTKFKVSQK